MKTRPDKIGNYTIEKEIDKGSTSEVWLAHHTHLKHRAVAIKLLLANDEENIYRFQREAHLLSTLDHTNIVKVFDYGYCENFYYSVLEYIHGGSLQRILEKRQALPLREAYAIFKQIGIALDYAHRQGIVHRDVSPGNVMIEKASKRALLTDFGIARDPQQSITVDYKVMGTPGYWSPEHIRSAKNVTASSDIYGLGVILYVMLVGQLPWDNPPGVANAPVLPPLSFQQRGVQHVPTQIEQVIRILLAENPAQRYPTAQDAIDELERIMSRHEAATKNTRRGSFHYPILTKIEGVSYQAFGVAPNDVETMLRPNLNSKHLSNTHHRAEHLCQPGVIATLLDEWSHQGVYHGIFRKPLLGRMARIHEIRSYNIYFYYLTLLYEERKEPHEIEEPDYEECEYPIEPEKDRWQIGLPTAQQFEAHTGGQEIIYGTSQVINCPTCLGKGRTVCPQCKGSRRVPRPRPSTINETLLPPPNSAARATGAKSGSTTGGNGHGKTASQQRQGGGKTSTRSHAATTPQRNNTGAKNNHTNTNMGVSNNARNTGKNTTAGGNSAGKHQGMAPPPTGARSADTPSGTSAGTTNTQRAGATYYTAAAAVPTATPSTTAGTTTGKRVDEQHDDGLVACPRCEGHGGILCTRCDGTGRLVKHKAFEWKRISRQLYSHDALRDVHVEWLQQHHIERQCIYQESCIGQPSSKEPALYPEWDTISAIQPLLTQAKTHLSSQCRLIKSQLTIEMLPITEIDIDLGKDDEAHRLTMSIVGFENKIVGDNQLLHWERILSMAIVAFLLLLTLILAAFHVL